MTTVNTEQATKIITNALLSQVIPLLLGPPGIGKSAIIRDIAEKQNLCLIDIRLPNRDPIAFLGFPKVNDKTGRGYYAAMEEFPIEGDEIPINPATGEPFDGWLIFFDEFPSGTKATQASAYKTLHEREHGGHKLHEQVYMVAAGNRAQDNAIVTSSTTAVQSRFMHLELEVDAEAFIKWARPRLDHRIVSWLEFSPDKVHVFKPDHGEVSFMCPRTWEMLSKQIINHPGELPDWLMPAVIGTVGSGGGYEFIGHCDIHATLPKIEDILSKPKTTKVPTQPDQLYFLSGALGAHATADNLENMLLYAERITPEFQVIILRNIVAHTKKLLKHPAMRSWIVKYADDII